MKSAKKRVVIVGGGFAGINAAKRLAPLSELEIILVDRRNHHLFQPLLYQVASAGLSPADIAMPIRSILSRWSNVQVRLDALVDINLKARELSLKSGMQLSYDVLILACGASHSYFGHEEWEPSAPGLKTLEQATEIRRRILLAFENAEKAVDPDLKQAFQTFVIVGAGPTGVELAGAIGEMNSYTLKKDFRHIDSASTKIFLLEGGARILPSFSESLSEQASRDLKQLGVTVRTESRVTEITSQGVRIGDEFIASTCVLWAAGVKPSSINQKLGVPLDKLGRVVVRSDLSLEGHPEVFVLGDQAGFTAKEADRSLPGLAPVAIQQGRHMACILKADLAGKLRPEFRYIDKGQMATVGRKKAIAESAGLRFTGLVAWMMWLFVHVYYLIGFRNRLLVMIQWAWSYLSFQRGARLIVSREWRSFGRAPEAEDR